MSSRPSRFRSPVCLRGSHAQFNPPRSSSLNRLLITLFAACIALMTACGGGGVATETASAPNATPTTPTTPTTPSLPNTSSAAWREPLKVSYQGVAVDVVIDKPAGTAFDVLLVYHGTAMQDALLMQAAQRTLEEFRGLLDDPTVMVVSVAYPEENLLIGDNLAQAEAALLWVKHRAAAELGRASSIARCCDKLRRV